MIEECLTDRRQSIERQLPEHLLLLRHVAPAKELEAVLLRILREDLLRLERAGFVLRQEGHRDTDVRRRLLLQVALRLEELPRDRREHASAVARDAVAAAAAAVLHAAERVQRARHDVVRAAGLLVRQESDAARVALADERHRAGLWRPELADTRRERLVVRHRHRDAERGYSRRVRAHHGPHRADRMAARRESVRREQRRQHAAHASSL
mmetsp:Transcript_6180/g.18472  ORF Transcript_6180/g.18472 Transcript_6180/m.18472 type:complete len:210 (+) Transcript_6180:4874-5503(+)